ncbi:stealth family protein [Streptomyces sp. NPDC059063]|uniref:stealth family protein n=1 Tax=unclassified Streptomyces TaxID=2593676 RepID=UPI0036880CFA
MGQYSTPTSRLSAEKLTWSTEQPALLRCYRRILPMRLRRALVSLTSVRTRNRLNDLLERLSAFHHRVAGTRARRNLRRTGLLAAPHARLVSVNGVQRIVLTSDALTPLQARTENLQLVCGALDRAGVDYFAVRGHGHNTSVIGVNADDREAAVAALFELCSHVPGYISHPNAGRVRDGRQLGCDPRVWARVSRASVFRFSCYRANPDASLVLGINHGCDIEFWQPRDGRLIAPRPNRTASSIPLDGVGIRAEGHRFTRLASPFSPRPLPQVRTRAEFAVTLPDDIRFPVDVVYTWVDGTDPEWQRRRHVVLDEPYHDESANAARYLNRDELRYSLRSVHAYAPWVRHVYLVTDRQVPDWLDTSQPGLTVVDHRDIFSDPSLLPTFNSHAIESQLHHIDGLSEHFLYFNDDVFLSAPVTPNHFFHSSGITKYFLSRALLPSGGPLPEHPPVAVAGLNNRALIEARFGATVTQKVKHVPHPLRRSILQEIEDEFPAEHRATAASRIRGMADLSIPASLHHYYALLTGRAVEGSLRYDYADISTPKSARKLRNPQHFRKFQAFCLNDTGAADGDSVHQGELLDTFLKAYFPVPGPYEKSPATRPAPAATVIAPPRATHSAPAPAAAQRL